MGRFLTYTAHDPGNNLRALVESGRWALSARHISNASTNTAPFRSLREFRSKAPVLIEWSPGPALTPNFRLQLLSDGLRLLCAEHETKEGRRLLWAEQEGVEGVKLRQGRSLRLLPPCLGSADCGRCFVLL
mmetsp:Transcript_156705/g.288913  ORF Transcript_156705/g.288913 Transcript_156705/m.288913 type:complete len:131 (+) Transcript_156705:397-789(+)